MAVLVDTNILLRRIQPDHPHHALTIDSVARLLAAGEQVCFAPQNMSEFWNVMTRPVAANALGFSPAFALAELGKIETALTLLPDLPAVYAAAAWSNLPSNLPSDWLFQSVAATCIFRGTGEGCDASPAPIRSGWRSKLSNGLTGSKS